MFKTAILDRSRESLDAEFNENLILNITHNTIMSHETVLRYGCFFFFNTCTFYFGRSVFIYRQKYRCRHMEKLERCAGGSSLKFLQNTTFFDVRVFFFFR